MLHKISYDSLRKAAIYGAVLSVSGCSVLYYLIQRNLASSAYYRGAVKALRDNQHACNLLGEPLRFQTVKLGDTENRITTEHAHLLIPVSGSKAAGHLRTEATFLFGRWELDSVVLEFRGRPQTLTIVDNKKFHVT